MNALGFVFSILIILSFGFSACVSKHLNGQKLRSSYLGHTHANRMILLQCETALYDSLPKKPAPLKPKVELQSPKKEPRAPVLAKVNPKCACLNLFPLIDKKREEEPVLYELTAKLFKSFYGKALFEEKPHAEFHFLKAFLKAIRLAKKTQRLVILEKLEFKNASLQSLYYKMLKGNYDPLNGYPSLLEYIKVDPAPSKICLFHADLPMIATLFGKQPAQKIHQAIHDPSLPILTQDWVERLCSDAHTPLYNTDLFKLIDLNRPKHKKDLKKTLIGEDTQTHISLKKSVFMP